MNTLKQSIIYNLVFAAIFILAIVSFQLEARYISAILFIVCGIVTIKNRTTIAHLYPSWMQTPRSVSFWGAGVIIVGLALSWITYKDV